MINVVVFQPVLCSLGQGCSSNWIIFCVDLVRGFAYWCRFCITFSVIRIQCYYNLVGCALFNVCVYVDFLECTYGLYKDVEWFLTMAVGPHPCVNRKFTPRDRSKYLGKP